jgi:hypothetical protein
MVTYLELFVCVGAEDPVLDFLDAKRRRLLTLLDNQKLQFQKVRKVLK